MWLCGQQKLLLPSTAPFTTSLSPDQTPTLLSSSAITTKVDPPSGPGPGPWMVVQHKSQFPKTSNQINPNTKKAIWVEKDNYSIILSSYYFIFHHFITSYCGSAISFILSSSSCYNKK